MQDEPLRTTYLVTAEFPDGWHARWRPAADGTGPSLTRRAGREDVQFDTLEEAAALQALVAERTAAVGGSAAVWRIQEFAGGRCTYSRV